MHVDSILSKPINIKFGCVVLLIVLTLLNVYDIYSTTVIMNAGGSELNPIMNFLMEKVGRNSALMCGKSIILLWIASLIIRAKTARELKILHICLWASVAYYTIILLSMNARHISSLFEGVI